MVKCLYCFMTLDYDYSDDYCELFAEGCAEGR